MQRRQFSARSLALASGLTAAPWVSHAQARKPEEGTDFIALEKAARTEAPAGKIEVLEFFWYKCPHCNRFEPELEAWVAKLPKDVHFRRVPVAFRDDFVPQQRLYYALEALGQVEKLHKKVFAAIHEQKLPLDTAEQITAWVTAQGVNAAAFTQHYESFSTQSKASRATTAQTQYKVSGVPSLGVAGKYYTDGALNPTMQRALGVVEHLVAVERAGLKSPSKTAKK